MQKFEQIFSKTMRVIAEYGCGFGLIGMMLYVTANVIARYVFNFVLVGMTERVGATLAPVTFLAFAHGWSIPGTFIAVNIIQSKLAQQARWRSQITIFLVTFVMYGLLLYGSFRGIQVSYVRSEYIGGIGYFLPAWPWRTSIAIGLFLFELRVLLDLMALFKTRQPITR